jgi:uncharacterized protein (TIGR03083 family)
MKPKPPVIVVDLFPEERQALLDLLRGLPAERWDAPTVCTGWTVKDLAAHLVGDDFNNLSGGRDRYGAAWFADPPSWDALVQYINERNEEWVQALRRLSPRLLVELLEFSGGRANAYYRTLDPLGPGPEVSWAGPAPAPMWLHIAREYTERWLHQQQIRDGAAAPPLDTPRLFAPVLDTFVHALPHTYRTVAAPVGTHILLVITGPAGARWSLVRHDGRWGLFEDVEAAPVTVATLDQDTAWRLFTRGIGREQAEQRLQIEGDRDLGLALLDTVAIIA